MLNSEFVLSRLGATAMETVNEYRLLSWLGMQEDIHRMVIYQVSRGTRFAICYRYIVVRPFPIIVMLDQCTATMMIRIEIVVYG